MRCRTRSWWVIRISIHGSRQTPANARNEVVRALALDPGKKKIGWAVVEKFIATQQTIAVIATGTIKSKKNLDLANLGWLVEVYKPDVIAYERTGSFMEAVYQEIITRAITEYSIPALGLKVEEIRSFLYGDGTMSKRDTNDILREKILNLRPNISRDELDAISVGFVALNMSLQEAPDASTDSSPIE